MVSRRGKKRGPKIWLSPNTDYSAAEMDEVYWYTGTKEDGINTYLMTMISRVPCQIVAFEVDVSVNAVALQRMVDSTEPFHRYFVDGCKVYQNVDYLGLLKQRYFEKNPKASRDLGFNHTRFI